jgi:hypothetical protein
MSDGIETVRQPDSLNGVRSSTARACTTAGYGVHPDGADVSRRGSLLVRILSRSPRRFAAPIVALAGLDSQLSS